MSQIYIPAGSELFPSNFYQRKRNRDDTWKKYYRLSAFPFIFDDFCMAYYDRGNSVYDANFVKKNYDQYSVAYACVFLMDSVIVADTNMDSDSLNDKIKLMEEIDRVKMKFRVPPLHYEDNSVEHSFYNFQHDDMEVDDDIPPPPPPLNQTLPVILLSSFTSFFPFTPVGSIDPTSLPTPEYVPYGLNL